MKHPFAWLLVAAIVTTAACSSTDDEPSDPVDRIVEMHLQNAQTYYWAGPKHATRAYQQASKALELDPENVKGRFLRAMSLIQIGGEHPERRGVAAAQVAEQELRDLKDDDDFYGWKIDLGIGWAQSEVAKLYQRRADRLEARLRDEPQNAVGLRADREEALERRDELLRSSNTICESVVGRGEPGADENFVALLVLNVNYTYLGATERALEYTERAVQVAQKSRGIWERWMERPTTSQAQFEEARAKLESATEKELRAREACADHLFRLKRYPAAAAHLDLVVELDPRRIEARLLRAQVNYELRRYADARTDLKRYFALSDEDGSSPTAQAAAELLGKCEERIASAEG